MSSKLLLDRLRRLHPAAHWQRIETYVSPGVPDVSVAHDGAELWLELKTALYRPRYGRVVVQGGRRREQVSWITQRERAGGWIKVALRVEAHAGLPGAETGRPLDVLLPGAELDWLFSNPLLRDIIARGHDVTRLFEPV